MGSNNKEQSLTNSAQTMVAKWSSLANECRRSTEDEFPILMEVLREGFCLLNSSLDRTQPTYSARKEETFEEVTAELASFYISMLVAASIRNSWFTIDLIASGAYANVLGLCRKLLECYKRAIYVRMRPTEAYRFMEEESIPMEAKLLPEFRYQKSQPRRLDYENALTENRSHFSEVEWTWVQFLWQAAEKFTSDTHSFNHASFESTMDMIVTDSADDLGARVMVEPMLSKSAMEPAAHALLTCLLLLNYEGLRRMNSNAEWVARWKRWNASWAEAWEETDFQEDVKLPRTG